MPQGVYPAAGDDRWLALSVTDDDQWMALVAVLDDRQIPERWGDVVVRRGVRTQVDARIASWSRRQTAEGAVAKLQMAGVPASVVATGRDVLADSQLAARTFIHRLGVAGYGQLPFARSPISLDGLTGAPELPHALGEDNEHVFREILGLSGHEYESLIVNRVIE